MTKTNKKGFTIVELVIVIAVIAILAAVLIPTFSNVIKNARQSAAEQACKSAYTEAYAEVMKDGIIASAGESATSNGFSFAFTQSGDTVSVTVTYGGTDENFKNFTYAVTNGKAVATPKAA